MGKSWTLVLLFSSPPLISIERVRGLFDANSPALCGLPPIKENLLNLIFKEFHYSHAQILFRQIKRVRFVISKTN